MRYKPVLFREAAKFTDDFNIVEDLIHDSFVKLIEKRTCFGRSMVAL